jgi:hypothetical protein
MVRKSDGSPATIIIKPARSVRWWEVIAQLACSLWLSASPFILHYAHQNHLRFGIGRSARSLQSLPCSSFGKIGSDGSSVKRTANPPRAAERNRA